MITIRVNKNEISKALNAYPAVATKNLTEAIKKSLIQVQGEATKKAPTDTGNLKSKWRLKVGLLKGELSPTAKYAVFVHEGTRPHFPPLEAITPWARRHGIPPFLVAKSIAEKGTKAKPFLKEAVEVSENDIWDYLEKAIESTLNQI